MQLGTLSLSIKLPNFDIIILYFVKVSKFSACAFVQHSSISFRLRAMRFELSSLVPVRENLVASSRECARKF